MPVSQSDLVFCFLLGQLCLQLPRNIDIVISKNLDNKAPL